MRHKLFIHCGLVLLFLCGATHMTLGRKAFSAFYCRKAFTDFGRKYVSNYSAQINADKMSIDFIFVLMKRLEVGIWMKLSIAQRATKNTYKGIFSYDINLCSFVGKGKGISLIQHWVDNAYKYTNLPKQCPVEPGTYYWKKLRPDSESIPPFLISGHFRINSYIYMKDWNNDMLTNTSLFVDIKMK